MNDSPRWRRIALGRTGVLATSAAIAGLLLLVGWLDYRAARREFLALVEAHAVTLRQTVGAATRINAAASALAEAQIAARVRDNARLLAALDRQRPLDTTTIDEVVARNDLFRVMLFDRDGRRVPQDLPVETADAGRGGGAGRVRGGGPPGAGTGGGPRRRGSSAGDDVHAVPPTGDHGSPRAGAGLGRGAGPGPGSGLGPGAGGGPGPGGPGPGGGQLVARVLAGEAEVLGDLHAARRPGAARLAAAVRRVRGGAILVNADATAVLALQQQASLDALLGEIVNAADDVAYIVVDSEGVRRTAGALPAGLTTAPGPAAPARRELTVQGRPVLEFSDPVPSAGGTSPSTVRIGMRLDDLRQVERRFLLRQGTSLLAALLLGVLALGFAWVRRQYGTLSEAHRKAREALERRDRLAAMGELASTVAHEIRNPLNAIAMSAQRLQREAFATASTGPGGDEEHRALVDVIRREADRINTRVQQFVAFARPPQLRFSRVALGPWLQAIVAALEPTAALRSVTLAADVSAAGEAEIDAEQLRQAVDNLLRNAIDATPPGGRVDVAAVSSREGHRLTVRDTGPGIPAEARPRIFDLYFTTKRDGTGVGLAVTHQIVAAHRGRIDVESTPGQGATFAIVLPIAR